MTEVKAFIAEHHDELSRPGAVRFFDVEQHHEAGFRFGCPCGCGLIGSVYVKDVGDGGPVWNVIKPFPDATMVPSIGFYGQNSTKDGHHWHGWLNNGFFTERAP